MANLFFSGILRILLFHLCRSVLGAFVSCHPHAFPFCPHHTQFAMWAAGSEGWRGMGEEGGRSGVAGPEARLGPSLL